MADSDYISRFSGEEVDQRLAAVATIQAALESLTAAVAAKYSKPAGGIPETDLDADVRAALALARSAVQSLSGYYTSAQVDGIVQALELAIAAKYSIPSGGIPASDLASAVQASLGKADTAYQKPASGIPASDLAAGVIPDVSGFVTKSVNDLVNYYLKSETYTKVEVQQLIAAIQGLSVEVVASLPTASADTMRKIYLVPSADPQTQNVKDEYITIDNGAGAETRYTWEQIGSTAIDLTGYVTTTQLNTALADYTTTANLTTLLAAKQDTISDLAAIRSGAAAGATAYQKPPTGIPASDLAAGVIPTVPTDVVKYSSQSLTDAQKSQARTNIAAAAAAALGGYYTKSEIDALLSAVNSQEYVDVTALPTASASTLGKIYLVGPDADNQYARYYTSYDGSTYSWVPAGSTEVNLTQYATVEQLNLLDQELTIGDAIFASASVSGSLFIPELTSGKTYYVKFTLSTAKTMSISIRSGAGSAGTVAQQICTNVQFGQGVNILGFIRNSTAGRYFRFDNSGDWPSISNVEIITSLSLDDINNIIKGSDTILDAQIPAFSLTYGSYVKNDGTVGRSDATFMTSSFAVPSGKCVVARCSATEGNVAVIAAYANETYTPLVISRSGVQSYRWDNSTGQTVNVVVSALHATGLRVFVAAGYGELQNEMALLSQNVEGVLGGIKADSPYISTGHYYYLGDKNVGDTVPVLSNSGSWMCAAIPVAPGNVIQVITHGGSNARPYAIADANNKLLYISDAGSSVATYNVTIPQKGAVLLVNCSVASDSYFSVTFKNTLSNMVMFDNDVRKFLERGVSYQNPPFPYGANGAKVLVIGNSYTLNSTIYLPGFMTTGGVSKSNFAVYHAFGSGYGINDWVTKIKSSDTVELSKVVGDLTMTATGTMAALLAQDWDIIIITQASSKAYNWENFAQAKEYIGLLRRYCTNQKVCIGYQMPWAHQNSDNDYVGLVSCASKMAKFIGVDYIIPIGMAIRNARKSSLENEYDLTSDGTHLCPGVGYYVASAAMFQSLISMLYGKQMVGINYNVDVTPSEISDSHAIAVTDANRELCQLCAFYASIDMYDTTLIS